MKISSGHIYLILCLMLVLVAAEFLPDRQYYCKKYRVFDFQFFVFSSHFHVGDDSRMGHVNQD